MGEGKVRAEKNFYIVCTVLTLVGTGLCIAGLFVPYWYEKTYNDGIVVVKVNLGIWLDRVCVGNKDCEIKWITGDDYDRHEKGEMPSAEMIRLFETVGAGAAFLSLIFLIPLWCCRDRTCGGKQAAHFFYFTFVMVAGLGSVVGTLILSSKGDEDDADWAAFLSGVGGALLFVSGTLACIICRYDPSYGTLENPVSQRYIISNS